VLSTVVHELLHPLLAAVWEGIGGMGKKRRDRGRECRQSGYIMALFFFPKREEGVAAHFFQKKKGQRLRKDRVCGRLKREDQMAKGRTKMDQCASREGGGFLSRSV
jgi:hypothetical protein